MVTPMTFAFVTANVINAASNWLLIFGHAGLPALGTTGSAWATLASRIYRAAVLGATIAYYEASHRLQLRRVPWTLEARRLGRLVRLGLPAGAR